MDTKHRVTFRHIRHGALAARNPECPSLPSPRTLCRGTGEKCISAKMDDYLTKPVDPDALKATLLKWLDPSARSPKQKTYLAIFRARGINF